MLQENLIFRPMLPEDRSGIAEMIKALYQSLEAPDDYITDKKIAATFEQVILQPEYLKIEVFELNKKIVGYALLFKFWYNEFGGMVLNIDELFVDPSVQGKGIASKYISELSTRKKEFVALSLEVLPENKGAFELYKRMGFEQKETIALYKLLEQRPAQIHI